MKLLIPFIIVVIASTQAFARPEAQMQIDTFFRTLSDKGAVAAVDGLCKGTLLESQKGSSQLAAVAPQLDAVIKVYGKVARTETVEKKAFGESFVRVRLISYHATG